MSIWQSVQWSLRIRVIVLFMACCMTPSLLYANDTALTNKRLFFTDSQRSAGSTALPESDSTETISSALEKLPERVETTALVDRPSKKIPQLGIHLNAVVSGNSQWVIMINGAPCNALGKSHFVQEDEFLVLNCPHIDIEGIALTWQPNDALLEVGNAGSIVARLSVGESI